MIHIPGCVIRDAGCVTQIPKIMIHVPVFLCVHGYNYDPWTYTWMHSRCTGMHDSCTWMHDPCT